MEFKKISLMIFHHHLLLDSTRHILNLFERITFDTPELDIIYSKIARWKIKSHKWKWLIILFSYAN
jgi:hypothetical protein